MNSLIEKFCNESVGKYGISDNDVAIICKSPFVYTRFIISSGIMISVRLLFFGIFEPSRARIKHNKSALELNYSAGTISEKKYNERIKILNNYDEAKEKPRKNKY